MYRQWMVEVTVIVDLWADGTDDIEYTSFIAPNNDVSNMRNGNLMLSEMITKTGYRMYMLHHSQRRRYLPTALSCLL
ncbi:MAG: hypothetical protein IPP49_21115 [Saprospiraceae bacterium]|nr:hypothetical protein [Saprospiraceae bacterium]